jgi:hypothetical protein
VAGGGHFGGDDRGDINPDVLIGAWLQDNPETDEGNVFVYHGCYCGVIHTEPAAARTLDNPTDEVGGNFGLSVSQAGDVNGDGFVDAIAGAPYQDNPESGEGNAFVYYGSATGLPPDPSVVLDNPGDQPNAEFGVSVE